MKIDIERQKETIEVWNVCECGRILHSMVEGQRGTCSSCWFRSMPKDTKAAMNKMIGAAFRDEPATEEEKSDLIDDAFEKLKRDEASSS